MHFGAEITSSEDKYCLQQAYKTLLFSPPSTPHESFILSPAIRLDRLQNILERLQPLAGITHPLSVASSRGQHSQSDRYLHHKILKL